MNGLTYRPDWVDARRRLADWWRGGDLGRPAMMVYARRETPWEDVPALPAPPNRPSRYSIVSVEYSINEALRSCLYTDYLGEAAPHYPAGDVAPGSLALYLGCDGVEMPETTWLRPCVDDPDRARLEYDPDNRYWRYTLAVIDGVLAVARGKFLIQFPDLIEGLDVLAALRGTESMLLDLYDRPEWCRQALRRITDLYFRYYDILYDRIRDEMGGSFFWCWAPGRMIKLQCDCSAMLSPATFREFMLPVLCEMTERVAHSMYHLDGVDALVHLDTLLAVPQLDMVQWTPGAGQPPMGDPAWWPMVHRVIDAGKKVYLAGISLDDLPRLRREFGADSRQLLLALWVGSREAGEGALEAMTL